MKLNGKSLEAWLKAKDSKSPKSFPGKGSVRYYARYQGIEDYLNANVHNIVNQLAMLEDGGFLTDHGPKHIEKVIDKASQLVSHEACELTPYEVYLLLVAIQLHDVGNIFGREGHELNSATVMRDLDGRLGDETVEKKTIQKIAQAHGGHVKGDKDKVGKLPAREPVLGLFVREQLIAAILKLSDELADDCERAARYAILKEKLPKSAEIYHKYAESLHSSLYDPKGREVLLHFDIPVNSLHQKYGKGNKSGGVDEVYLLDEIFERTIKTHLEVMYCSRFLRPYITIDNVSVKIDIYNNEHFEEVLDVIGYRLVEKGYPDKPFDGIYDLCPELNDWKGQGKLTGGLLDATLKAQVL